ncbi:MAG: response regulator, partial [Sedimenticola sp.]|nr:response regulator [Sedimenticola sp.]
LFETTLNSINVPGAELPDWRELIDEIHQYRRDPELAPELEEDDFPASEPIADEGLSLRDRDSESESEATAEVDIAEEKLSDDVSAVTVDLPELDEELDEVTEEQPQSDDLELVDLADEIAEEIEADTISEIDIELDEVLIGDKEPVETADSSYPDELEEHPESPESQLAASELATTESPDQSKDEQSDEVDSAAESITNGVELDRVAHRVELADSVDSDSVISQGGRQAPVFDLPVMIELEGDPELVDIFLEEARELHEALEGTLQSGDFNLADKHVSEELQRTLHTLKGGARLAGAMPIGDLSHGFESLLTAIDQGRIPTGNALTTLTHEVIDRLAEQIDDLGHGPQLRSAEDLVSKLDQWLKEGGEPQPVETPAEADAAIDAESELVEAYAPEQSDEDLALAPEPEEQEQPMVVADLLAEAVFEQPAIEEAAPTLESETETASTEDAESPETSLNLTSDEPRNILTASRGQREQVRVRSDLLDRLVNYAGEVSIYRTRIEQQNGQLGFNLTELEQTISRLREQLRQLEIETEAQILFRYEQDRGDEAVHDATFDPLELDRFSAMQQVSRSLMETVNDLANINGFLEDLQSDTDTLLLQQSRITTDLQDGLMRTRMVPFAQIVPRLHRVVRQTCNQLDKKAELVIRGEGSEIDRGILERMIGPLEHILRNAIAHGIETPTERQQSAKSATGTIRLDLSREGSDVQLVISDDGAGVNMAKIRERAIKSGLLDPNADVSDTDVLPFVLEHGFSTAQEITQISGRGVGLDVVVSEVKQLGGSLDITSQPGEGAKFIIRLPLTLAITDALLVELSGEIYAIPHTSIEGVVRVSLQELEACYSGQQALYNYAGQDYQVRYLGSMLNVGQVNLSDQRKWYPLLLVRAGEHHVALQVDGLLGNRQIVVKSVGIQVATVRWISGGTILGDGRVALILDVTALVRSDVAHAAAPKPELATVETAMPEPGVGRTVMVVDDSITVRKVTGRLLERHGMNVITAKDGVDAVATLQEQRPDIMLLDIEMPRMDGYELARHMRSSDALKSIPIIMITSRTGEKHRNLAMELGVKRYLGKPYQESELLDNIYSVL